MYTATDTGIRELDHRTSDGIDVTLLWSSDSDRVWIALRDDRFGEALELEVDPAQALAAFHHPYAYATGQDAGHSLAA